MLCAWHRGWSSLCLMGRRAQRSGRLSCHHGRSQLVSQLSSSSSRRLVRALCPAMSSPSSPSFAGGFLLVAVGFRRIGLLLLHGRHAVPVARRSGRSRCRHLHAHRHGWTRARGYANWLKVGKAVCTTSVWLVCVCACVRCWMVPVGQRVRYWLSQRARDGRRARRVGGSASVDRCSSRWRACAHSSASGGRMRRRCCRCHRSPRCRRCTATGTASPLPPCRPAPLGAVRHADLNSPNLLRHTAQPCRGVHARADRNPSALHCDRSSLLCAVASQRSLSDRLIHGQPQPCPPHPALRLPSCLTTSPISAAPDSSHSSESSPTPSSRCKRTHTSDVSCCSSLFQNTSDADLTGQGL